MFKMLALNDVAYAAKIGGGTISGVNELNLLAPGALAIFDDNGVFLSDISAPIVPATFGEDVKWFQFAVGKADGSGADLTDRLMRRDLNYEKEGYTAGVAKRSFLGNDGATGSLNLPTLVEGDEAFVKIVDRTTGLLSPGGGGRKDYRASYVLKNGDGAAEILAGLKAELDANDGIPVTTTIVAGNVGLQFDAIDETLVFQITHDGVLRNSTVIENGESNSLSRVWGAGTPLILEEDLKQSDPEFGKTQGLWLSELYYKRQSNADLVSGTYDTYLYEWDAFQRTPTMLQDGARNIFKLAMPVGAAIQGDFDLLMASFFATNSGAPIETGA